jgi:hypothetical protein
MSGLQPCRCVCKGLPLVRKRLRRGPATAAVGVLSDPPILVFSLSIGKDS